MARTVELLVVVCMLMSLALTGCTSPGRTPAQLAAAVQGAWASGDRAAFLDLFTSRARARAEQLWTATTGLRVDSVQVDDETWAITWSTGQVAQVTTNTVTAVVDCPRGQCQLIDLTQAKDSPAPAWITGDLVTAGDEQLTVIAAPQEGPGVLAAAVEAMALVQSAPTELGLEASTPVVIEVPDDVVGFEQIMAAPEVYFRASGALTWTAGSEQGDSLLHIVVNPTTTRGATHEQWVRLLAHELVHVSTAGIQVVTGRQWVAEGLAEALSVPADPTAQLDARVLASRCPLAQTVIEDQAFTGTDASFAYAWSRWAVAQILDTDPGRIPQLMVDPQVSITLDDRQECGLR